MNNNFNNVRINHMITIGSENMIVNSGKGVKAKDNLAVNAHPSWSHIALYEPSSLGTRPIIPDDGDDEDETTCTYGDRFTTLEDVEAALNSGKIKTPCAPYYVLQALESMLITAQDNYTSINQGYDEVFGYYETYIKALVPSQLSKFMNWKNGTGNKYFTCKYNEGTGQDTVGKCPLNVHLSASEIWTLTYHLDDEAGFFAALSNETGIQKSWVKFDELKTTVTCHGDKTGDCTPIRRSRKNYPQAADSGSYHVTNPKDLMANVTGGMDGLRLRIQGQRMDIGLGQWLGTQDEVIDAMVVPVSLVLQAIDTMAVAKKIGIEEKQREDEEHKRNLIITIISAILFFIPFVGEAIGPEASLFLQTVGQIIRVISAVGNVALAINDIVQDPTMAGLAVAGLLLGSFGREAGDISKITKAKRGLTQGAREKIGPIFLKNDAIVQRIIKRFCK